VFLVLRDLPSFALSALIRKVAATVHHYTYKALPPSQTKNVVIVGGSFAGYFTAKFLSETLPTGYRVVLVEKNSHFNYVFAFPRFSVVGGYENLAFTPYGGLAKGVPNGVFEFVQGKVESVDGSVVSLEGGKELEYAYLVVATGTSSALPSKVAATESLHAQGELKVMQSQIEKAARIAVVGGGAVGIEVASDIKDVYPEKNVVLLHSRDRLLPSFGERLHEYVTQRLGEMGVEIWFNERPQIVERSQTLKLKTGKEESFDLIVSRPFGSGCPMHQSTHATQRRSHVPVSGRTAH
jgi:NADH dehydrogenase FAD-containing subunit